MTFNMDKFFKMNNSPLSENLQELAAGYVLDDLEAEELARAERLMNDNPAFLREVRHLQTVTGEIINTIPRLQPPPYLLDKIMVALTESAPRGGVDVGQMLVNLGVWLEETFQPLWQSPEELNLAFSARRGANVAEPSIKRGKVIRLNSGMGDRNVILLVGITPLEDRRITVNIQLYPGAGESPLPANLELALLGENGEVLRSIQSRQDDNYIKLPGFTVNSGFRFLIQISWEQFIQTENFVV